MVIRSEWQNWNDSSAKSASNSSFHARRTHPLPALPAGAINDDGRGLRSDSRTGEREGRLLITFLFFFIFLDLQTLDVSVFPCYCSRRASVAFWSFRFGPVVRYHYGKDCVYISFFSTHFTPPGYLLRRLSGLRSWRAAATVLRNKVSPEPNAAFIGVSFEKRKKNSEERKPVSCSCFPFLWWWLMTPAFE